jgi:thioredoxin 1
MRKLIILISLIFSLILSNCNAGSNENSKKTNVASVGVIELTNETFKQKVYNYDINKEWKFEGNLPVIIDFYANWCGPCRQLSPRVEEIAKEFVGKIIVYKVNTDVEKQLAQNMGITGLPTLFFIPVKGQPQSTMGALSKEDLVKAINEVLLVK